MELRNKPVKSTVLPQSACLQLFITQWLRCEKFQLMSNHFSSKISLTSHLRHNVGEVCKLLPQSHATIEVVQAARNRNIFSQSP